MLIKRVYEINRLSCPRCAHRMNVAAFIDPPQGDVIEKILRHCGLSRASAPRASPDVDGLVHELDGCSWDSQTTSSDQFLAVLPGAPERHKCRGLIDSLLSLCL